MRNLKTLVSQVEKVLQDYPKARNSDKWLTYKLWCDEYPGRGWTPWVTFNKGLHLAHMK